MKITDTGKRRLESVSDQARSWVAEHQGDDGVVGIATELYGRDRDAFASVLGSAIALRLFLFVIPADITLLGLLNLLRLKGVFGDALESSVTTGAVAANYQNLSVMRALWVTVSGLVLTLWAGRSLTRVLATCPTASWQLHARAARVGIRAIAALSALVVGLLIASISFARMRDVGGIPASLAAWVAVAASAMVGWFFVQLALPRGTHDPGAVLPGTALMGVGFAVLQWFMQIYLPGKIERSADTFGTLSSTVASLGYFFFIGRLMTASFVVNAVVFERWGGISQTVFGLPVLRRLPARSERLRRFFDLSPVDADVPDNADR